MLRFDFHASLSQTQNCVIYERFSLLSHTPNFPRSDDSDQSHWIELLRSFRHPIKHFQCNSWKCATTMRGEKSAESSTCIFSSPLSLACEEAWGNYKCSCPPPPPSQFIEWDEWIKCHQTSNVSACFSSKSSTKWWVDASVEWVESDWRCESFTESWAKVKGKCVESKKSREWCNFPWNWVYTLTPQI